MRKTLFTTTEYWDFAKVWLCWMYAQTGIADCARGGLLPAESAAEDGFKNRRQGGDMPQADDRGFDRLLIPAGQTKPLALLPTAEWLKEAHRSRAVRDLMEQLKEKRIEDFN